MIYFTSVIHNIFVDKSVSHALREFRIDLNMILRFRVRPESSLKTEMLNQAESLLLLISLVFLSFEQSSLLSLLSLFSNPFYKNRFFFSFSLNYDLHRFFLLLISKKRRGTRAQIFFQSSLSIIIYQREI